ncbi:MULTISPECIES: sigma-70 family RNA polymerase sigma factor [unclassified Microcoleus]|uniref:sigma-70 family RNA polymerase sigma factor n=1 Tax=unclassified Microcoleus TaxID=2642155 RepID=UPI002FCEE359
MNDQSHPSEGEDQLSDDSDAAGGSGKSGNCDRDSAQQQILELVIEACKHPVGSLRRSRFLNKLIREIIKSGKLWKENTPHYEEALHKTWIYLSGNLCEATTAKQAYNPEISQITTWLNPYLKKRLLDCHQKQQQERARHIQNPIASLEELSNREDIKYNENLKANPDVSFYLDELLEWIETDPNDELKNRHVRGKPQINCQVLLQRKCLYGQTIQEIAKEFGCANSTLYQLLNNDCRHLLQNFSENQGYQTFNIPGVPEQ